MVIFCAMEKKLTKRQLKRVAKIWAAGILRACDSASFDGAFSQDNEVVQLVHGFAADLLGTEPAIENLEEIINYVREGKRFGYCRRQGFEIQKFQPCINAQ